MDIFMDIFMAIFTIDILPYLVAIFGITVGPIIQLCIAKGQQKIEKDRIGTELKKIQMEHISGKRQQWIDEFRNEVTELNICLVKLQMDYRFVIENLPGNFDTEFLSTDCKRVKENILRAYSFIAKIRLRLNLGNSKHQDLENLFIKILEIMPLDIGDIAAQARNDDSDDTAPTLEDCKEKIIEYTQSILKEAWEEVKNPIIRD